MVQRTEVVRAAELRARQIVEGPTTRHARRCATRSRTSATSASASFEIVLDKLSSTVAAGRERAEHRGPAGRRARARPDEQQRRPSSTRTGRDVTTPALVVNVAELLRRPASQQGRPQRHGAVGRADGRRLRRCPDGADLDRRRRAREPDRRHRRHGPVSGSVGGACRRCLEPVGRHARTSRSASSTSRRRRTSDEAFTFSGEQLDLEPLVREAVLLELPLAPLCRPDCAGLCADLRRRTATTATAATPPSCRRRPLGRPRRASIRDRLDLRRQLAAILSRLSPRGSASDGRPQEEEVEVEDPQPPGRGLAARRACSQRLPALRRPPSCPTSSARTCGWYKDRVAIDVG